MYKHIVIAVDGSELATRALKQGLALAKALGSKVTITTVSEPVAVLGAGYATISGTTLDPLPELIEAQAKMTAAILKDAAAVASAEGVAAETVAVDNSYAAEGIIDTAEKEGADLIVMGSHGRRGVGRLLLGSQTSSVLAHTKIPVLVTR